MFTLVMHWGEIPKDTYASFCESHVIPQLLTMVWTKFFYCLALDECLFLYIEIHKVLMFDELAMKLYREMIEFYMIVTEEVFWVYCLVVDA
ncbi:MAG: hypothetical protein SOU18_03565 [Alloprevotella sp.]|nr:hypothetical protein [Alloprevotella sp.]